MIKMAQEQTLLETVMLICTPKAGMLSTPSNFLNYITRSFSADFERYLSSVSDLAEQGNAKTASLYSFCNAVSPVKSNFALRSLPVSAGGYAIPKVELNTARIQQLKKAEYLQRKQGLSIYCFLKGNYDADTNRQAAIEYNGAVHELAEVSTRDYRRTELVSAGIMEFVIGKVEH